MLTPEQARQAVAVLDARGTTECSCRPYALPLALVLASACAERIDGDWKLVDPDRAMCTEDDSWVVPGPSGGISVHPSLPAALGFSATKPAFGDLQIENGTVFPYQGGWIVSVAGPDVPKRWAASHVYWTDGRGTPLELRGYNMVSAVDERGFLGFSMCFWYERGSHNPTDVHRRSSLDDTEEDLLAGPYWGVCITAAAEAEDGTLWVIARRYEPIRGPRADEPVDDGRIYLARLGDDGHVHYEFALERVALGERWDQPSLPGFGQLVVDGRYIYVSGPGNWAQRLEPTSDGWVDKAIVPRNCRRRSRPYPTHTQPLPPPDAPSPVDG